ncbi:uncharacterized protein LOC111703678 [Eurytemora carolleeae]|uniref:uncharacterized protein LOC111703678 n=1 Tax=Eurytemora carolleeae TaxID=1294199 RepID=UPI000C771CB1|nr:uncharacterized protein LOC111703678 [Eurytemora carolleeae]|eukprot:XP_023331479.1 uncharacterized protein LOC111703678 [Eurytemora affinis]
MRTEMKEGEKERKIMEINTEEGEEVTCTKGTGSNKMNDGAKGSNNTHQEKRIQFQQYKDKSQSSSKHERDVDIRRRKDPKIEKKKVDHALNPTALENRKRKRSSSPDHERKLTPKENRKKGRSVTPEKKDVKFKETNHKTKGKKPNYHIFCICGIQTYKHGMLKCTECRRYSHAECYKTDDLSVEHICGGCAVRENKPSTTFW